MRKCIFSYRVIAKGLGVLLAALFTGNVFAITPPPLRPLLPLLDTAVIKMNLSLVPTGILEDFGETPVILDAFNGVSTLCDTNYVNFRTLNGILSCLASSKVRADLDIPSDITDLMSQYLGNGINPVGVVVYKYNHTNDLALANHLLEEVDNQIFDAYDSGGNWINPYDEKYVVAFSPYMNVSGGSVTYSFRNNLTFTNETITSILFNAGDGNGFRPVPLGSNVHVTYSSPQNPVELKLRVTLSNGAELDTHSFVTVLSPSTSAANGDAPDYVQTFTCDSTYLGYTKTVEGMMSVKYASGHTSLIKPLIVAEGFDPFSDPDGIFGTDGSGRGFCNITDIDSLIKQTSLGYDLIYIDWKNSCAPIQSNAEILRKIIEWVNTNKTSTEKNILIGQSMGGLISRYGLRKMEQAGIPHDVKVYVSDDSPHYGVNVPMGYVYMIQKVLGDLSIVNTPILKDLIKIVLDIFSDDISNADKYISELYNLREAPSVRQMMMHYISPETVYDSQMYNDFQTVLNEIGFPQGDTGQSILNFTISNGGLNGYSNNLNAHLNLDSGAYGGLLAPIIGWGTSSLLFRYTKSGFFRFSSLIPGIVGTMVLFCGPRIQINVYPNYQATQEVYDYTLSWKKYHGILQNEIIVNTDSFDAPPNSLTYDNDAGSYYRVDDKDIIIDSTYYNKWWGGYHFNALIKDRFLFVPSVSSLAYKKQRSNVLLADRSIDFASDGINMDQIPFDGYKFVRDTASYHTRLDSIEFRWIDRASSLSIEPTLDTLLSGHRFTLNDTTVFVRWSVADTTVATINPSSGVISLARGGSTTAYADIDIEGGHLRLSRDFFMEEIPFPGFPTYIMSQVANPSFDGGYSGSYTVQARESASVDVLFRPQMTCHWGIKSNTNDSIVWTTSPYSPHGRWLDYFCYFPESATERMVYFYVSYRNQVSPMYSIFCRIPPTIIQPEENGNEGETE